MRWSWLTRTRGLAVLVGVAFLLVLFSPQIQRRPLLIIEQPLLLIESWLQRAIGGVRSAAGSWSDRYVALWDLEQENRQLRDEAARLRQEVTQLEEQIGAAGRRDDLQAFGRELTGKAMIEALLAERARQLGAAFTLARFMDELNAAGMIPLALVREEIAGN